MANTWISQTFIIAMDSHFEKPKFGSDPAIALLRMYPRKCMPAQILVLKCLYELYMQHSKPETTQMSISLWSRLTNNGIFHTMEFHSVMKRNKILMHIAKWMVLTNIITSERSQMQKAYFLNNPIYIKT